MAGSKSTKSSVDGLKRSQLKDADAFRAPGGAVRCRSIPGPAAAAAAAAASAAACRRSQSQGGGWGGGAGKGNAISPVLKCSIAKKSDHPGWAWNANPSVFSHGKTAVVQGGSYVD